MLTKTGANMGHGPKVTRSYSFRKPAANVAAIVAQAMVQSGALALIFIKIPEFAPGTGAS